VGRFSNWPFEVKHFQTIRHCNVDVAHGLALLFGIGTRALVWGFQGAAAQAADMLKVSCQTRPEDVLTPSARLAAVGQRLDAMLRAVKTVRMAMNDFYRSLTDEQKAAFDAIGPQQAGGRRTVRGRV
jgi:hypothetical protein